MTTNVVRLDRTKQWSVGFGGHTMTVSHAIRYDKMTKNEDNFMRLYILNNEWHCDKVS